MFLNNLIQKNIFDINLWLSLHPLRLKLLVWTIIIYTIFICCVYSHFICMICKRKKKVLHNIKTYFKDRRHNEI